MALKLNKAPDDQAEFISEIPIEECVHRLVMLENGTRHLTLNWANRDQVDFTLRQFELDRAGRETQRLEVSGSLRRWRELQTRVRCSQTEHSGIGRWLLIMAAMLGATLLGAPLLVLYVVQAASTNWLIVGGLAIAMIGLWVYLALHYAPADDVPTNLLAEIEETLRY